MALADYLVSINLLARNRTFLAAKNTECKIDRKKV